jgi:hypothetical protein
MVHVIVPVPPTAGKLQDQPFVAIETKVVFAGIASEKDTEVAVAGPWFDTTCV